MCFSAPASFVAAGVTGLIGIASLRQTRNVHEWPLAAMPLLFAAQQAVEGMLWLTLPTAPETSRASLLTLTFLLFAKVLWPVYAPLAAVLVEPNARRRAAMSAILVGGIAIAVFFLRAILGGDRDAWINGGHIVYESQPDLPLVVAVLYMASTCAAPLLSSHWPVQLMAVIVLAGAGVTYVHYWEAFSSIWCFFAALASAVIYFHFARLATAGAAPQAK